MVEPEILIEGNHSIEKASEVASKVLDALFNKLKLYQIDLSKVILKTGMIVPGKNNPAFKTVTPEEVAKATIECFSKSVPANIPTINFLSGGLSDEQSYKFLSAVSREAKAQNSPWNLSFSYGRAIQRDALKKFGEEMKKAPEDRNEEAVQQAFLESANKCRLAALGQY
jgi:fructose-bisphosphate aldolase class I